MISNLIWVESAILTALLYIFGHDVLHPVWILPILLGFYVSFAALFMVYLTVTSLFLNKKVPEHPNPFAKLTVRLTAIWVTRVLGTRLRVKGKKNELPSEPAIFICNHRSALDPFFIIRAFRRRRFSILSKDSVRKYPIIGDFMNAAGVVFIDRDSPIKALRGLRHAARYIKEDNMDFAVFPEGTRSRTGELLPFKSGAFVLAKKTNVPIVILTMQGADKATKYLPFRGPRITVTVEEILPAEKVEALTAEQLSDYTYGVMKRSLEQQAAKK